MPEQLDGHELDLLDRYRKATGPDPDGEARLRGRLRASVQEATSTDAVVEVVAYGRRSNPWLWAAVAVAASLLVFCAVRPSAFQLWAHDDASQAPYVRDSVEKVGKTSVVEEPAPVASALAVEPADISEEAAFEPTKPPPEVQQPARPKPDTPKTRASELREETVMLKRAEQALRDGAGGRALEQLEGYAHRFPNGLLGHEYRGLRAVALCMTGNRAQGRGEARVFLRRQPHSALARRIRTACDIDAATETGPSRQPSQGREPQ